MMKNLFNSVAMMKPKKNKFDLTHDVKMSGVMGNLMPCMIAEAIPGDKFSLSCDTMVRFAPLIAPVMHRMDVSVHYFFVPNRILWENWEKFITNEVTAGLPYVQMTDGLSAGQKKLADYLGVPPCPTGGTTENVNALPFAAYQKIYNDYYRDENLISDLAEDIKLVDGFNAAGELLTLRKRAWEHDYFTASLPFAQKGQSVDIPLGDVKLKDGWLGTATDAPTFVDQNNDPATTGILETWDTYGSYTDGVIRGRSGSTYQTPLAYDPKDTLTVGATTINELRRAEKLQQWLEKNARGGTRYIENILAHFGVRSSDKRLQRPEYITGTKSPVVISEVLNSYGDANIPTGSMAGHGVSIGQGYNGSYYVEEHGYILGIMSVMPKTCYQQGIPKNYLKQDPLDFYWPTFANIGEQEVKLNELYAYTNDSADTFGYVPRYAEYKYIPSRVAGDFRTSLSYWHLGRIFGSAPTLSQEFIEVAAEDVDRVFAVSAVSGDDNLYIQVVNKVSAIRPMPVYGTPML